MPTEGPKPAHWRLERSARQAMAGASMPPPQNQWFEASATREDLAGKTIRGGAWIAVARTIRGLVDLAATVVLARLLTPADFGLVGLVAAVTAFVVLFKDLGLSTATIQREDIDSEQVSQLFWLNASLGLGLSALTAGLAPGLAWFFEEPRLTPITLALSSSFAIGGFAVQHRALLVRNLQQSRLVLVELGSIIVASIIAIVFAVAGAGPWALVVQIVATEAVATVLVWFACSWRPGRWRRDVSVRPLLKMGGHLTIFSVVNYFARNLDDILIGRTAGPAQLGLYQQAYKLMMIPLRQVNQPVGSVAKPALSRLAGQPDRYRRAFERIIEKVFLVTMPLGAFMFCCSANLILLVFGPKWLPAADIFRWLGLLVFSQPLGNATGWLFVSQGRTASMMRWGFVGSGLSALSFVAGLPWGPEGVAMAYAGSGLLVRTPLLCLWVGREGPVSAKDLLRMTTPFLLAAGVTIVVLDAAVDAAAHLSMWPQLGIGLSVCVSVFFGTLALFSRGRRAIADIGAALGRLSRR